MTRQFVAMGCLFASVCTSAATSAWLNDAAPVSVKSADYTLTDRLIVRLKSTSPTNAAPTRPITSHAQSTASTKSPADAALATRANRDPYAEHRSTTTARLQLLTAETLTPLRTMGDGSHVVRLSRRMPLHEVQAIANRLAMDPDVLDVLPDRLFFPQLTPNDPQYANQWALNGTNGINAPAAWDITTGSPNLVIGVLDTGMLPHNDLAGRWIGGYDFVSLAERSNDGNLRDTDATDPGDWVTVAESASGALAGCTVTDSRWHGTTMAGVIAANANNAAGIAGINWNSKLLPVRVVGKCGGYESDIADGLRWAAGLTVAGVPDNPNPARVVNMSLAAGGACSSTMQSAIDAVINTNTVIVAAAGNQSTNASGYSPGNCASVITVGAVDKNGGKPTYTNFGANVSLSAPGGLTANDDATLNVLTTHNTGTTTANTNYDYIRTTFGTSISTAQVTGIVSLMLSINPTLMPQDIKDILQNTSRIFPTGTTTIMPNPSQADCTVALCGEGIVNASKALLAAQKWGRTTPQVVGGFSHSIGLRADGKVVAWGANSSGQLGNGGNIDSSVPTLVAGLSGVVSIARGPGANHALAVRADGTVWAWGDNTFGQLGDGTAINRNVPIQVPGLRDIIQVEVSGRYAYKPFEIISNFNAYRGTSFALKSDGTLWAWGTVDMRPFTDGGMFPTRYSPGQLAGVTSATAVFLGAFDWQEVTSVPNVAKVTAGVENLLLQLTDATVKAVGSNFDGQYGNGLAIASTTPQVVIGLTNVADVAAGDHSLAIGTDGTMWAWGLNGNGQLGDGTTITRYLPTQLQHISGVTAIGAGTNQTIAVKRDGSVFAWGENRYGAVGDAGTTDRILPTAVVGLNGSGFLNLGVADPTLFASQTDAPLNSARVSNAITGSWLNGTAISVAGGEYSLGCGGTFVTTGGTIASGQSVCVRLVASGGFSATQSLTLTIGGVPKVFSVTTLAADTAPDPFGFAPLTGVALGGIATSNTITISGINTPAPISVVGGTYSIGCNGVFTAAVGTIANGESVCVRVTASASTNTLSSATLTAGGVNASFDATTVVGPGFFTTPMVAAGTLVSAAIGNDGTLYTWGENYEGQLGDGSAQDNRLVPGSIPSLAGMKRVAWGNRHAVALRSDGTVWTWGYNLYGALGDGTNLSRNFPVRVPELTNVIDVAAGNYHSLALKSDGTVWGWGRNYSDELGDQTRASRLIPIRIGTINTVVAIRAGGTCSLMLKADGTVWGCGCNFTYGYSMPVGVAQISGISSIAELAVGEFHYLLRKNDGSLLASGGNDNGELGDGTTTVRVAPVAVSGLVNVAGMSAGRGGATFSLALNSAGNIFQWGSDNLGEFGDGGGLRRLTPTQIPGISGIYAVSAGQGHALAIKADGTLLGWGLNNFGQAGINVVSNIAAITPIVGVGGTGLLNLGVADPTSFAPQTEVPPNSLRTSNTITGAWLNGSAVSITGGEYSIGCGTTFTNLNGVINSGQSICVRQISSAFGNTTTTVTLTIAGVNKLFSVTTRAGDITPDIFRFPPVGNALPGVVVTSLPATITGVDSPAPITVTGGSYSIGCTGAFVTGASTILNMQTVCVRLTAAATDDTLSTATVSIGTTVATFDVMTRASPGFQVTPMIASGNNNGYALRSDGTLFAWGVNNYGELGTGTLPYPNFPSYTPVPITGLSGVRAVATSLYGSFTLAARQDGTVWVWGQGLPTGLVGFATGQTFPVRVGALQSITAVAAGWNHALALKSDGTVWTWGGNGSGQLGDGTTQSRLAPAQVAGIANVISIAAAGGEGSNFGIDCSWAAKADGSVWHWGSCGYYGIGLATIVPTKLNGIANVVEIVGGGNFALMRKSDGTVWAIDVNDDGSIGLGGNPGPQSAIPVQVPGLTNIVRISAGGKHALAVRADGVVFAWGNNGFGQLGDGTHVTRYPPVQLPGLSSITQVAAGRIHSHALASNGSAYAWGAGYLGKLGIGSVEDQPIAVAVVGVAGDGLLQLLLSNTTPNPFQLSSQFDTATNVFVAASPIVVSGLGAGVMSPIAITGGSYSINGGPFTSATGTVSNGNAVVVRVPSSASLSATTSATLTIGGASGRSSTFYVRTRRDTTTTAVIPQVALGNSHSYVLNPDAALYAVGYNGNGQLGNGTTLGTSALIPVAGLATTTATASGAYHGLALRNDGTVLAWGYNAAGQLGHGLDVNGETNFVTVSNLSNVVAIAAGDYHSLALNGDGTVWAWGLNVDGQIGQGSTSVARYLIPVQVAGLNGVTAIAAGGRHNLAVLANGSVVAWGSNSSGQLGDGSTISKSTPAPVNTLGSGVLTVSAGGAHSLAIKADSSAVSWGDNAFGQLGDGTLANKSMPVAVTALGTGVALIAAGANHSLAVKSGGALYTWGANTNSQLGDGGLVNRSTPFNVANPTNVVAIAGGGRHSAAINNRGKLFIWGDNYFGQVGNKSGNYNPNTATLNVLRGDSEISTVAQSAGSSTGTASASGSAVIEIAEIATGYDFKTLTTGTTGNALGKFKNQALTDAITGIGISVSGPGFSLQSTDCNPTLSAGTECNFAIGFTPSMAGDAVGELQVASSLVGSPERRSLFGTGLPPATPGIKVNATAGETYLSFSPQDVGVPSTASNIVITNTGTAPLIVSSASITKGGSHFSVAGNCTTSISAGTSCTLPITFNPALAGGIDGQLALASNAGSQIVTLFGTGVGTGVGGGLILNAVMSRKVHGAAGIQELIISTIPTINQQVTVEPRMIGAGHQIVFQFNATITNAGSVTVKDAGNADIGNATVSFSNSEVVVTLTNIPDAKRVTITLNNVNGTANPTVAMGFLVGDVTNSRSVNAADIAAVKARVNQAVTNANFKYDINANGTISSADVSAVKARAGMVVP